MTEGDFRDALRALADRGERPTFWLRDDDATDPTPALETLLAVTRAQDVPVTLAVIPARSGQALADRLAGEAGVTVAVHGWAHVNHAGPDEKKQELGAHRPVDVVLGELGQGLRHLRGLHGAQCEALLVPPWNRIHPAVVAGLPGAGFTALSVFGPEKPAPLRVLNTHVDLMDWHGTGRAKPLDNLLSEAAAALDRGAPVGFLTHHLIHDDAARDRIGRILALTRDLPETRWAALPALLAQGQ